jgi:hypothetical protein
MQNTTSAGGTSGSAVAAHTPLVRKGGQSFAVSRAQYRLLKRASAGSVHVKGAEVRTARALASLFGTLHDDGSMKDGRNVDGERWLFTIDPGVSL